MTIRIFAISLEGGAGHEHIATLWWHYDGLAEQKNMTRQQCVSWLESSAANQAFTEPPTGVGAQVFVRQLGATKFVQSYADGKWANNLLALPRY